MFLILLFRCQLHYIPFSRGPHGYPEGSVTSVPYTQIWSWNRTLLPKGQRTRKIPHTAGIPWDTHNRPTKSASPIGWTPKRTSQPTSTPSWLLACFHASESCFYYSALPGLAAWIYYETKQHYSWLLQVHYIGMQCTITMPSSLKEEEIKQCSTKNQIIICKNFGNIHAEAGWERQHQLSWRNSAAKPNHASVAVSSSLDPPQSSEPSQSTHSSSHKNWSPSPIWFSWGINASNNHIVQQTIC